MGKAGGRISWIININPPVGRSPKQLDWLGSQVVGRPAASSRDGLLHRIVTQRILLGS